MKKIPQSYTWDLFWLCLLIGSVFFIFLGVPPLNPPDEPRYAEIPREMLAMHQFIIPYLNGLIYFEKPPLAYWMVAGFMKVFGYSEWAVRASVAVMGTLGCLATYALSRKLFNRRTGVLSALILSSSLLYFAMSHMNTTDMSVTFCLTLSIYSFLIALQAEKPLTKWLWLGYFFAGLAMMAKGLIGIAFPAMIVFIWIAATQNWRLIKNMRIISGFLIILAVNLPWLLLAQAKVPDFLHFYFIEQQILRYATPIAGREMCFASYIGVVLAASFPWVAFLPQTIKYCFKSLTNKTADQKNIAYLMVWPFFIVLFFAFSNSILIPYLLPITPPLAILVAHYFDKHCTSISFSKNTKVSAMFCAFFYIALSIGLIIYLHISKIPLTPALVTTGVLAFLTGCFIFIWTSLQRIKMLFISSLIGVYAIMSCAFLSMPSLSQRSIKPLALTINRLLLKHPNAEIATTYYYQDLPYYTKHIVTLTGNFGELTYGVDHDKNSNTWMINNDTFWQRWDSTKRLYVITKQATYKTWTHDPKMKMYFIQKTQSDVLITNKDPS